jgi:hypothetical protein
VAEDVYFGAESVSVRATWRLGHTVVRVERIAIFSIGRFES